MFKNETREIVVAEFPHKKLEFSDKDALINHINIKIKGNQNVIEHYEKEIAKHKQEIAEYQEYLDKAQKL